MTAARRSRRVLRGDGGVVTYADFEKPYVRDDRPDLRGDAVAVRVEEVQASARRRTARYVARAQARTAGARERVRAAIFAAAEREFRQRKEGA